MIKKLTTLSCLLVTAAVLVSGMTACRSTADKELEASFRLNRHKKMNDKLFAEALRKGADPDLQMKNGSTPLIGAVIQNRPDHIQTLLDRGADVNGCGTRNSTPLQAAAGLGREKCIEILLKAGAKINTPGAFGRTPLMEAARIGNIPVMEKLLAAGAEIEARDNEGRTPLMHAAKAPRNSLEAVKFLISKGADFKLFDSEGRTAIMHAALLKHTDTALYLLTLHKDLSKRPGVALAIMYAAIKGNDILLIKQLLEYGVPLNRSLSMVLRGTRALQIHGIYRILIRHALISKGRMPLHWAAIENNLEIVKLLIENGADPLQPDELGHCPDELALKQSVIQYIRKEQKIMLQKYHEMKE